MVDISSSLNSNNKIIYWDVTEYSGYTWYTYFCHAAKIKMAENSTRPMKETKPIVFLSSLFSLPLADSLFFSRSGKKKWMAAETYLLQPTKKSANTQMFFWAGIRKERHKRPQMEIKPRLLWSSQVRYSESLSRETHSECGYWVPLHKSKNLDKPKVEVTDRERYYSSQQIQTISRNRNTQK